MKTRDSETVDKTQLTWASLLQEVVVRVGAEGTEGRSQQHSAEMWQFAFLLLTHERLVIDFQCALVGVAKQR